MDLVQTEYYSGLTPYNGPRACNKATAVTVNEDRNPFRVVADVLLKSCSTAEKVAHVCQFLLDFSLSWSK